MNAVAPIRPIYRPVINLRDAAIRAIEATDTFNAYRWDDAEWDRLNGDAVDARAEFLALLDLMGLDKPTLGRLQNSGVL